MIDIEQRSIGSFGQNLLSGLYFFCDQLRRVDDHVVLLCESGECDQPIFFVARSRRNVKDLLNEIIKAVVFFVERVLVQQVAHPQINSQSLSGVSSPDALAGRADLQFYLSNWPRTAPRYRCDPSESCSRFRR